jgi:hypothetical protein
MAQPSKRLIRNLLDPQTSMDDKFIAAEEVRRKLKERTEIYDVTAWSLPLLFNVEAVANNAVTQGSFEMAKPVRVLPGELHTANATVAFLAPWGSEAAGRLLAAALRQDLKVFSSDKPFTQGATKFPAGTLIFKVAGNPADLGERLARLARETGADVYGANSGWVDEGVNFGSRYVLPVRKPAIALAWDTPAASSSAGAARFVLERQYGYPVTPVRTAQLNSVELARFQVLILPDGGGYAGLLGDAGIQRVKAWVQAGGVIVALGGAVGFLTDSRVGLLDIVQENVVRDTDEKKPEAGRSGSAGAAPAAAAETAGAGGGRGGRGGGAGGPRGAGTLIATDADYEKAIRATNELPDSAPGALARARVRPDFWLTAGVAESVNTMVEGRAIYTPVKADKGVNAVYFDAADKLLASGYLWSENRKQMAYKPLVVTSTSGRGVVVGFTEDPNFRGMLDGMNVLFLNAVFRGPAHARAAGPGEE